MVSKILTVRNTIQDVLGIRVSLEDANEIIERLEAWQAKQAVEQPHAPDALLKSTKMVDSINETVEQLVELGAIQRR